MIFLVKSSDKVTVYQVNFSLGKDVRIQCDCPAGVFGKICKHKIGLLLGEVGLLADSNQADFLMECIKKLDGSDILKVLNELNEGERQLSKIKKICEVKKKSLEKLLQGK